MSLVTPETYHQSYYKKNRSRQSEKAKKARAARTPERIEIDRYKTYLGKLRRKFNTTEQHIRNLMDNQLGCCDICRQSLPLDTTYDNGIFCIDHDHITGKVRGLLCQHCNKGIGMLGDDPIMVDKAAEYLRKYLT